VLFLAQTECEEMLVVIVQEKRVVDEQQKQVRTEDYSPSLRSYMPRMHPTCRAPS